jgi:hypothetical protein
MKRKHLIIGIMLLMSVAYLQAQGGGQRGERPDPKVTAKKTSDTWQEEFGLSDDQHKKVYDILIKASEERTKTMTAMRSGGQPDRTEMQKAMTELLAKTDESLKKVFTETQWPLYEKWKKENPPQQRRRRGGN